MISSLAPCIAVVGPANSGKTTLLHLLDRELQRHYSQPLVYVVKGSPDGTGRFLFHVPELRNALKDDVKGRWIRTTSATVSAWIANCRAHLDLVLLDFGGKHGPDDDYMLQHCSHFLVLARYLDESENEAANSMESWIHTCLYNGLKPVARLYSLWREGEAAVAPDGHGVLEGTFRADASRPDDTTNAVMIKQLVEHFLGLRQQRTSPSYLSLKLLRDWKLSDLPTLGGRGAELDRLVASEGMVILGGVAPIWVYGSALHRVLDQRHDARVAIFDPKAAGGLVEIPRTIEPDPLSPLAATIRARWEATNHEGILQLTITTDDKMLPPMAFQLLSGAPLPQEPVPEGPLWTSGPGPIWLHLTYSRWLRRHCLKRELGVWDARSKGVVFITGPSTPRFQRQELPRALPDTDA